MSENITSLEAAKKYMVAELSRIFPTENIQQELVQGVNSLSEKEVWRLLEALSFSYRMNRMFSYLSDASFVWKIEDVDIAKLTLTGMKPEIDLVTHGSIIRNDPIKFRDYLFAYFKKYPDTDPEGLEQFRPSGKTIQYPFIFLENVGGKLNLLDGSNRVVATLLQGKTKIKAFIGTKTASGKPQIGDSTFWLLRHTYESGSTEEKEAVLVVVRKLIQDSSDGKDAIKEYWVRHNIGKNPIKKIGESLI